MSIGELGCTYACLILSDDGIPVTSEKISTILKAANVNVESYWPSLFSKLAEKRSIDDLVMNVGAGGGSGVVAVTAQASGGGAAEAKAPVEEKKGGFKLDSERIMKGIVKIRPNCQCFGGQGHVFRVCSFVSVTNFGVQ
ncbi:large ribosomal subunit protein P1A-like [Apium graveolens]|uniref:large ribosomal subunit protein P1A-like n=1 Tax=Apium graveolens TaxID=4045 RepID=UPI003D7A5D86